MALGVPILKHFRVFSENSKWKKEHKYVKTKLRVTCSTFMGLPFDSKQLI